MYPLVLSTLAAALLALSLAATQPADMERLVQTRADAMAENFWTYRSALVAYQNDHFATSQGYIANAAMTIARPNRPTGYFPLGYEVMQQVDTTTGLPVDLWSNYFEGGRLYTFSRFPVAALPSGLVDTIANRHGRSLMIGVKQANGTVVSMYRLNTPPHGGAIFTLPPALAVVPNGAVVVIGN